MASCVVKWCKNHSNHHSKSGATCHVYDFTDAISDDEVIASSQPISLPSDENENFENFLIQYEDLNKERPAKYTGQFKNFRSIEEIEPKYKGVFSHQYFNVVQSKVIDDALYSDKSVVVCAPTGSGKTVLFEMAIVRLLMNLDDQKYTNDFKIIYMAPVKALCTERLTEWYPKFTKLGLSCIEVTGDTDVDFSQLKPYRIIITTPEKWDMLTRRWRDYRGLVEVIKLFLIDEVHILNDEVRGPVLEAVVSRMKTIEYSAQSAYRIEHLQRQRADDQYKDVNIPPKIRFMAVSATVSNPEDVAAWLGSHGEPAVYHKFGDECRPVKLNKVVEGYPCPRSTTIFKFDIILNYKLWPIIQKYYNGKPTLIFCNTRKSVILTAETLSREITINFIPEQKAKLTALASHIKTKKLQALILSGVGCHHAGLLFEERSIIEQAFRNRDLPILITTTTLAMGVNLPAHLVIVKNTQQYVNGAYQEYSISTVLQMVGRAGRPQFDSEATAVIMTRMEDKHRYQALVGGEEPLQSYLHKRLAENLNSEAALGTVADVAQCVQWLNSTFLSVRATKDPRRYLGLPYGATSYQITKKLEELCVRAMNGLSSSGLISMDEACCIESTEAGRLMSVYYLDVETMKLIMKINGSETLDRLLWIVCESHELSDMHLRVDERRCLNALNRNNAAATIRYPMKGKISTRQMKLNCVIQAVLGCLPIPEPSLNQEAMKIMRIADRICKCLVAYITSLDLISKQPEYFAAVLNSVILAKCIAAHLWENSPYVSKQLKGIGPTFSTLLASAGKVNFLLLEESHPRDLERVMNKGPPAGNVLRKQISLLPKYQLTMTPIDEKTVKVQVLLLNQSHLAENLEQLTAGENHKCYLIVGDSDNHLMSLACFKDKDLIGVYDGSFAKHITRIHDFEHKILAHVVSSNFVGVDTQCEYVFKDIQPYNYAKQAEMEMNRNEAIPNKTNILKKQSCITDTFKERKRKNTENDLSQCKEKKKRENALIEKFQNLKKSFGTTSKKIKDDMQRTAKILQDFGNTENENPENNFNNLENSVITNIIPELPTFNDCNEEINDNDGVIDDEEINNIINEIEKEITHSSLNKKNKTNNSVTTLPKHNLSSHDPLIKLNGENYSKNRKSNYNFIDLLDNNVDLSDEEKLSSKPDNGFSNAIKCQLEQYLNSTTTETVDSVNSTMKILNDLECFKNDDGKNENQIQVRLTEINNDTSTDEIGFKKIDKQCLQPTINNMDGHPTVSKQLRIEEEVQELNKEMCDMSEDNEEDIQYYKQAMIPCDDFAIDNIMDRDKSTFLQLNDMFSVQPLPINGGGKVVDPCQHIILKHNATSPRPNSGTMTVKYVNEEFHDNFNMHNDNSCQLHIDDITREHYSTPQNNAEYKSDTAYCKLNIDDTSEKKSTKPQILDHNIYTRHEDTENTNKKSYIKQYSLKSTKINFSKKQSKDHEVKIMRKVQLDLNVTEIVSKECKPMNPSRNVRKNSKMSDNTHEPQSIPCPTLDLENKIDVIEQNEGEKCIKYEPVIDPNKEIRYVTSKIESPTNTVDSILEKYGKLLRNKGNHQVVNKNTTRDVNIKQHIPATVNTNRPFKISNIHMIQASLPETFNIQVPEPQIQKTVLLPTIQKAVHTIGNTNTLYQKSSNNLPFTKDEQNSTDESDTEILDEEDSPNFNIDEVIFNPKALLQTLEETDVIPPPPQFLDESGMYSPVRSEDSRIIENYIGDDQDSNNDSVYSDNPNKSCDINLTPSREIETWKLDASDTFTDSNRIFYSKQSFPITQRERINIAINKSNIGRLEEFNFKGRKKLKL